MKNFSDYLTRRIKVVLSKQLHGSWHLAIIMVAAFLFTDSNLVYGQAVNLDQARNGKYESPVSPVHFQNGNLGFLNAHFIEGYSVPYRAVMTGLTPNRPVKITLGFDIKHSDKNALDFITYFDRLESHVFFDHAAEQILPAAGTGVTGGPIYATIPPPALNKSVTIGSTTLMQPVSSYNELAANDKRMTLWGGTFAASNPVEYDIVGSSLDAARSEVRIVIKFTPNQSTAVLAWGGHIASRLDWGFTNEVPNSAGGISGSPYHMRVIGWNLSNLGQQDRSLKADAVFAPPLYCQVLPAIQEACVGDDVEFEGVPAEGTPPYTFKWQKGDGDGNPVGSILATTAKLKLTDVQESDAGEYVVTITDNFNQSCVAVTELTVNPNPNLEDATADYCEADFESIALTGFNDDIGAGVDDVVVWYSDEDRTAVVTMTGNLAVGEHKFYATVTNESECVSDAMVTITILANPVLEDATANYCEGEMVGVLLSSFDEAIGADETVGDVVVWYSDAGRTTVIEELGDLTAGEHVFFATVTRAYTDTDSESCASEAKLTVTVEACSKIRLKKLTDGLVDPARTWSFTISGGDLAEPVTETVENDADGILFESLVLSKDQAYTICETNVGASFTVAIKYRDANGILQDISWYDPQVINGGGDFNQGEAIGNYCFKIGAGTDIPLLLNTYGSDEIDLVFLEFEINNIPPPGGDARTPGYWKNWNSCSGGQQFNKVMEARTNGGEKADFWLLDDHLPHTLWGDPESTSACGKFTITTCEQAVLILDERQNGGKNTKMSSDAAYKLAKHLFTYQLNKKSGTYECTSAAEAASEAEGLLARICFDGTKSSYLSNKGKGGGSAEYNRALELAKTLDAYNNNLACEPSTMSATVINKLGGIEREQLTAYPTPFSDKATIEFTTSRTENYVVNLYDMRGVLIKQVKAGVSTAGEVNQVEVDGSNMSEGLYLARVVSDSGARTIKLLLKK